MNLAQRKEGWRFPWKLFIGSFTQLSTFMIAPLTDLGELKLMI